MSLPEVKRFPPGEAVGYKEQVPLIRLKNTENYDGRVYPEIESDQNETPVTLAINACEFSSPSSAISWWKQDPADVGDADPGCRARVNGQHHEGKAGPAKRGRVAQSGLGRVAHGVAYRVDRLKAIGNGQVPGVAAAAWRHLISRI